MSLRRSSRVTIKPTSTSRISRFCNTTNCSINSDQSNRISRNTTSSLAAESSSSQSNTWRRHLSTRSPQWSRIVTLPSLTPSEIWTMPCVYFRSSLSSPSIWLSRLRSLTLNYVPVFTTTSCFTALLPSVSQKLSFRSKVSTIVSRLWAPKSHGFSPTNLIRDFPLMLTTKLWELS